MGARLALEVHPRSDGTVRVFYPRDGDGAHVLVEGDARRPLAIEVPIRAPLVEPDGERYEQPRVRLIVVEVEPTT
jgi:hypothetical protein